MLGRMRVLLRALVPILIVASACAPAAPEADITKGQIRADERDYGISLTSTTVRPGQVTFIARNTGATAHDLIVLKTDLANDKIPLDGQTGKAKEDGKVDGLTDIPPGQTRNLRVDLPAGHYVLICNVPGHYQLGMHTDLTVQ